MMAAIILFSGLFGLAKPAHASFFSDIFSFFVHSQNSDSAASATSEQMPILQAPLNSGVVFDTATQVSDAVSTTSSAQTITFSPNVVASSSIPVPGSGNATSTTYVVQSGDTLLGIALQYGTTVSAITTANNLHRTSVLRLGEKLTIPSVATQ